MTCRRRLSGIYKVTTPLGIRVELMDVHAVTDLKMVLDFWKPDGVIAEGDAMTTGWVRLLSSRKIPTVLCDPKPEEADAQGCHLIMHNSRDTARLAVRELLSLGYASYGCVEYWDAYDWSDLRVAEFEETVRKAGSPGKVFRSCAECKKGDVRVFLSRISEFIASLPKPCGIFAVNDEMAMNVMSAALMSGYNIPHDVAIASIDNDELLCDNAPVSLSSIAPDFEKSGRLAAELLLKTIDRPDLPLVVDHYGAAPLVGVNPPLSSRCACMGSSRPLRPFARSMRMRNSMWIPWSASWTVRVAAPRRAFSSRRERQSARPFAAVASRRPNSSCRTTT